MQSKANNASNIFKNLSSFSRPSTFSEKYSFKKYNMLFICGERKEREKGKAYSFAGLGLKDIKQRAIRTKKGGAEPQNRNNKKLVTSQLCQKLQASCLPKQ